MCSHCAEDRFAPPDYETSTLAAAADHARLHALPADDERPTWRELREEWRQPMSAEVADVLDKAAEVIETRGWWQHDYGSDFDRAGSCQVCVFGALKVARGVPVFGSDEPVHADASALEKYLTSVGVEYSITHWNDHVARTADEVITALRNAAAAERAS